MPPKPLARLDFAATPWYPADAAGGQLAGLTGAVLAVPLLGVLRVLFDFLAARGYLQRAPGRQPATPAPLP